MNFGLYDFSIAFIDGGHNYKLLSLTHKIVFLYKKAWRNIWHDYDMTNPAGKYLHSISQKYDIKWIENTRLCILNLDRYL